MLEVIGHRGYRAKYPENTIFCYDRAYEAGSTVIETDLQLTKDGRIVMNHDAETGRVWDQNHVIAETNLEDLLTMRSKLDPTLGITTFKAALEWLVKHPTVTLMLDIKPTNDMLLLVKVYQEMIDVLDDIEFWRSRLMFGLWRLDWYENGVATGVLKGFRIVAISLALSTGKQFLDYSNKLNDDNYKLFGISVHYINSRKAEFQKKDLPYFVSHGISVYLWTVNYENDIKYISELPIAGVIVDNPGMFVPIVNKYAKHPVPFTAPMIHTSEGVRYYLGSLAFELSVCILYSSWGNKPMFGKVTISWLYVQFLRKIHFI